MNVADRVKMPMGRGREAAAVTVPTSVFHYVPPAHSVAAQVHTRVGSGTHQSAAETCTAPADRHLSLSCAARLAQSYGWTTPGPSNIYYKQYLLLLTNNKENTVKQL